MIDSVTVSFPISPTLRQLEEWKNHPLILPTGEVFGKRFKNAVINDTAPIDFTFFPPNPKYVNPALHVQVSLPKVLFGNNVEMITSESEIEQVIAIVNSFIAELKWMPEMDLGAGRLYRVDAAYNYQVGERVEDYISAISKSFYPNRKTGPYLFKGIEGVQFTSLSKHPSARLIFYDKWKESHLPSAYGCLRQESSLRHANYIERRTGIDNPTLRDVKIDWLIQLLQIDLKRLHLDKTVIYPRDMAQEILVNKYGYPMGIKLHGHLIARQSMTREQMIASGAKQRTLQHWEMQIADAGMATTMTDKVALPALSLGEMAQWVAWSPK